MWIRRKGVTTKNYIRIYKMMLFRLHRLLTVAVALLLVSCGTEAQEPQYEGKEYPDVKSDNTLRILAIGNSFTENMTLHLPRLIADAGADSVVVAYAAFAGASLEYQMRHLTSADATHIWAVSTGGRPFVVDSVRRSLPFCVDYADWDIIVIQQKSTLSGLWNSVAPYLAPTVRLLKTGHPRARIAWQMTWAFASHFDKQKEFDLYGGSRELMEQAIEGVVANVASSGCVDLIIHSGRAVAVARREGVDASGFELSRDGRHLDEGAGCYIAACCAYERLIAPWTNTDVTALPVDNFSRGDTPVTTANCQMLRQIAAEAER